MNWVTIKRFLELSGYTKKVIELKVGRGALEKDIHWVNAPDGRILDSGDSCQMTKKNHFPQRLQGE
ncbi:MAG: hypothetical protein ABW140_14830 [Candidatus Sedimenticola sp. 6PFRAG1]